MSDEADIASDAEELFRSAQLAHIRALAGIEIKPSRVSSIAGRKPAKGLDSATRIASLTMSGEIRLDSRKTLYNANTGRVIDTRLTKLAEASTL